MDKTVADFRVLFSAIDRPAPRPQPPASTTLNPASRSTRDTTSR